MEHLSMIANGLVDEFYGEDSFMDEGVDAGVMPAAAGDAFAFGSTNFSYHRFTYNRLSSLLSSLILKSKHSSPNSKHDSMG